MSFVLPVYNAEPYLARCLDSILCQSIEKEIIIVNDGSTDGSLDIAKRYLAGNPHITLIQQHNRGVSAARNAGLRLAAGEYVYFIDPDDCLLEPRLDAMAQLADETAADWFKGLMRWHYSDGRQPETRPPESPNITAADQFAVSTGAEHLHQMLARDWFPSVSFGFFRTEFLRKNKILFPEGILISEDALFVTDCLSCEKMRVVEIGRLFYDYYQHPKSTLHQPHNVAGFESLFAAADRLWAKLRHECARSERNTMLENDILRVIVLNYHGAYRFQYLSYDAEHRARVRHYFTPEVIGLMEKMLPYKVLL